MNFHGIDINSAELHAEYERGRQIVAPPDDEYAEANYEFMIRLNHRTGNERAAAWWLGRLHTYLLAGAGASDAP